MLLAESTRLLSRYKTTLGLLPEDAEVWGSNQFTLPEHGLIRIRVDNEPSLRFLSYKAPFTTTNSHTSSFIDPKIDFKHS